MFFLLTLIHFIPAQPFILPNIKYFLLDNIHSKCCTNTPKQPYYFYYHYSLRVMCSCNQLLNSCFYTHPQCSYMINTLALSFIINLPYRLINSTLGFIGIHVKFSICHVIQLLVDSFIPVCIIPYAIIIIKWANRC